MTETLSKDSKLPTAVAATASLGAVACAVCCVLPFALPAALAAALGGVFVFFESAFPLMRWAAILSVSAGWLWVFWESIGTGKRSARSTLVLMTIATIALAAIMMWPALEGPLIRLVR